MTTYIVQVPPKPIAASRPAENPVVLPDRFSWGAFFFGPLWLVNHGAFAAALVDATTAVLCVYTAIFAHALWAGLVGLFGAIAARIFFGFEGFGAVRAVYTARGFRFAAVISAADDEEAVLRYLISRPDATTPMRGTETSSPAAALFPSRTLARAFRTGPAGR